MSVLSDTLVMLWLIVLLSQLSHSASSSDKHQEEYVSCGTSKACPTWFVCNSENNCQCGDTHDNAVVCDNKLKESAVLDCNCETYDKRNQSTYAGLCFYNCQNSNPEKMMDYVYTRLPRKPEELLNKSACTHFHRTGLLCGDCEEEHSPFVLSYSLSCVRCPNGHKNWWKFVLAGFVPLTFFYVFIVIFNINVTSSRLHGVVWFSQTLSTPALIRLIMSALSHSDSPQLLMATKTFLVFYSFWNLDILRSVIPDICLHVTTLQALALDYLIPVYPFMLFLLSYILIELHDRQYVVVVVMWKPFRKVLSIFRKSWNIRTSVIDSFATFFLLSYVKVLNVTMDILIPTSVYKLGSTNSQPLRLFYSPTVQYFGYDHLPYAIIAITILTLFVGIPTMIFILYPFRFFQRFLSFFPINWHFLHAFVDSFQGCYKDGTEPGTFDCRWFSSLVLLIRLILFMLYGVTLSMIFFVFGLIAVLIFLITAINIQPFKKDASYYPITEMTFYILFSFIYVAIIARDIATTEKFLYNVITLIFLFLTVFVPIVYIAFLIGIWMISRLRQIKSLIAN